MDKKLTLRRPITALIMNSGFINDIVTGKKKVTLREGWRDYQAGDDCILSADVGWGGWQKRVRIVRVLRTLLANLSRDDLGADGFLSLEDAIQGLSRFYPNIDGLSPVTLIEWSTE